ncbi:hypothetical protein N0V84_011793 [Fusarium piperis]|uniref:UBX domain-containing protein 2 n=1 Tax=Fusarium piperis TaxID=1435070 RepID=A0A9W8W0E0_9HYPO|nr:hypothetical protein N0V84_011793 [Fusarium piperis]
MFYQGTLQDGISTAVGQQKLVLCFVTDESEEGVQWENEFLTDETLSDLIKDHAVALRLTAGSEEAGYLAQIFPLPRTPTVVIIKNGDLKEYITPGTSKEDFIRRVQSVFNSTTSSSSAATQPAPAAPPSAPTQPEPPASAPPAETPQTSTSETVRRILADRAARLQAQREAEKKKKAKEERAKADAKAKAATDNDNAAAHKAADAVRKRKQQDQEERARILKRIADDKAERRMRAEERQKLRAETVETPVEAVTKLPSMTKAGGGGGMTALQVRLFDGSTLRSRFKSETALKEVRGWVDESRTDGKQPYTFKQVLTPLPNKNIDETEEDKAIGDLGLSPSSTLVLIPVKKYVSAYDDSGNVFTRFIYFILGLFTWLFGSREDGGAPQAPAHDDDDAQASSRDESRIRAFQNQQRDQQLYNGNSLNFEPRPDEEEKDA